MTNLWKLLKTLTLRITENSIRGCTLYRRLQQLLQWLLSTQPNEYLRFAAHLVRTYLSSLVISTWLYHYNSYTSVFYAHSKLLYKMYTHVHDCCMYS